ncbi:MAG: polysaccharide deacetylase family protein [Butyrivibrio sp.]|nr:polysaccharide deacetylase family protein [Butyrivibrio sp.]
MSSRKKCIFFVLMIMIVSLLLFLSEGKPLERKQSGSQSSGIQMSQETSQTVTSRSIITADYILVEKVVTEQNGNDKELQKIALTFDDGPHPHYTEQLLDGLKERGVHATFFVTGEHAELHPDIIKRMYDEGHLIGNHTYSHIQLTKNNRDKFKAELVQTSEVIEEITGEEVIYVRPPYGTWDKKFEEELNMIPVLWTIDPLDWCSNNAASVVNKIVTKAEENDIILMHDYYDTSVTAALQAVDRLLQEGYEFVTVDEIIFD